MTKAKARSETKGKRRPTAEDIPGVLLAISEGQSLRRACEDAGLDAPSTYKMIDDDEETRQQYARARAMGGDVYVDQMKGVTAGMLAKKIKPDVGRAVSDNLKWISGRMAPKAWGDKQQHEVAGEGGGAIVVQIRRFADDAAEESPE